MKKHFFIILVYILLVATTWLVVNMVSKDVVLVREMPVISEDKNRCERYKEEISKEIIQFNASQTPEIRDSDNTGDNPSLGLYVENNELKDIFYSPKEKSCLYLVSLKTLFKLGQNAKVDIGNWEVVYDTYNLINISTREELKLQDGMPWIQRIHRGEELYTEEYAHSLINEYR